MGYCRSQPAGSSSAVRAYSPRASPLSSLFSEELKKLKQRFYQDMPYQGAEKAVAELAREAKAAIKVNRLALSS